MRTITEQDAWAAVFAGRPRKKEKRAGDAVDLDAIFRQIASGRLDGPKLKKALGELRESVEIFDGWLDTGAEIHGAMADSVTLAEVAADPGAPGADDRLRKLRKKYQRSGSSTRGPRTGGTRTRVRRR